MSNLKVSLDDLNYLLSPKAIREKCAEIFQLTLNGKTHFVYNPSKLSSTVEYVIDVIKENYPDLKIPYHSRWGHFQAGGIDRRSLLEQKLSSMSDDEKLKAKWDLTIISVLLDAGAGKEWKYFDKENNISISRSEGLAIASLHMFENGLFSSNKNQPFQVDSKALQGLTLPGLSEAFQISDKNPLLGLEGRLGLCHALGKALENRPADFLFSLTKKENVQAIDFLNLVLKNLGEIWPGRVTLNEINMGDLWPYKPFADKPVKDQFIPFHKLSQWLTYSLIEPFEEAGYKAAELNGLTGLAEYRNGGLLLDSGLIELADPAHSAQKHAPSSDLIIEWRALTIHLLDLIGEAVRGKLGMNVTQLPLVKVLEGGTWHAGRKIAKEKRADGTPPLNITSDGTVF